MRTINVVNGDVELLNMNWRIETVKQEECKRADEVQIVRR